MRQEEYTCLICQFLQGAGALEQGKTETPQINLHTLVEYIDKYQQQTNKQKKVQDNIIC